MAKRGENSWAFRIKAGYSISKSPSEFSKKCLKSPSEFSKDSLKSPSEFSKVALEIRFKVKGNTMYLRRKIDKELDEWFFSGRKSPALVVGIRQCGKTRSIEEFAERIGYTLVKMNFWDNPEYRSDFDGKLDVDTLISNISLRFPETRITPEDTLIFFDEIQECPRARLSFKNFEVDGRYHVIGSGSYLGIKGYVIGDSTPAPTGYDEVIEMKTMDFEEFLWAMNYRTEQIDQLLDFFSRRQPIPDNLHRLYKDLFSKFMCIGGFPKVVREYVMSKNLMSAYRVLQSTVFDMKTDFGRRQDKNGAPLFKPAEVARIQKAFDLIPVFLSKENKRFIVSKITAGSSSEKSDAIEYLKQAHIVVKVHNVEVPSLPLEGQIITSQFKLFPEDMGIVTSMYGTDTLLAISKGTLGQGAGAIYESAVFDGLNKAGFTSYYFAKESGLEIDFVIAYQGCATLVEAKTTTGNVKSSKTVMRHPEHYGKTRLIKIGDYNVSEESDILTIPHYLVFALGKNRAI